MYNMKTVDVRTFQHNLGRYLDQVEHGETLEIRRRRKVIAKVVPFDSNTVEQPWPDLMERVTSLYPDGPIAGSAAEELYRSRGDR